MKQFLTEGDSPNTPDPDTGELPLSVAVEIGFIPIIEELINAGAAIDEYDLENGFTAMDIAIMNGHNDVVELLLEKDYPVDAPNLHGQTPLHIAAESGAEIAADLLLKRGAMVDIRDVTETTPLIAAVGFNKYALVNLLLVAGANPNNATKTGITPLYAAVSNNNHLLVSRLLSSGANADSSRIIGTVTVLGMAVLKQNITIIQLLVNAGANINDPVTKDGKTAVDIAAKSGDLILLRQLIKVVKADITKLAKKIESQPDEYSVAVRELITSIVESKRMNLLKHMWTGMSRADIDRLNVVFGSTADATNLSLCPVCLKFVLREEGCKYMSHNCKKEGGYYHKGLYERFQNLAGEIMWCSICNRICSEHRHYRLAPSHVHHQLHPFHHGVDIMKGTCKTEKEGGGGPDEKILRFRGFKAVAAEAQEFIGKKPFNDVMDDLVEAMWDAPIVSLTKINMRNLKEAGNFNISSNVFLNVKPNVNTNGHANANAIRLNATTLQPIVRDIETEGAVNAIGMETEGAVVYFRHKTPTGTLVDHMERKEGIGVNSLVQLIQRYAKEFGTTEFGFCPFGCGAFLYPDEIKPFVPNELFDDYRKKFNRKMIEQYGVRNRTRTKTIGAGAASLRGGYYHKHTLKRKLKVKRKD